MKQLRKLPTAIKGIIPASFFHQNHLPIFLTLSSNKAVSPIAMGDRPFEKDRSQNFLRFGLCNFYLLHRVVSSAVTSGRWALRSHICKSGASSARQRAAVRTGRLYISRKAGFASSSANVSSRAV